MWQSRALGASLCRPGKPLTGSLAHCIITRVPQYSHLLTSIDYEATRSRGDTILLLVSGIASARLCGSKRWHALPNPYANAGWPVGDLDDIRQPRSQCVHRLVSQTARSRSRGKHGITSRQSPAVKGASASHLQVLCRPLVAFGIDQRTPALFNPVLLGRG